MERPPERRPSACCGGWLAAAAEGDVFVALAETLDAACSVDDALLAREVRVAVAADVEVDALFGGVSGPGVTAGATYGGFDVLGVDVGFHAGTVATSVASA